MRKRSVKQGKMPRKGGRYAETPRCLGSNCISEWLPSHFLLLKVNLMGSKDSVATVFLPG